MNKILTYHKIGINFDSSICWVDHYTFLKHIELFKSLNLDFVTLSDNIKKYDEIKIMKKKRQVLKLMRILVRYLTYQTGIN